MKEFIKAKYKYFLITLLVSCLGAVVSGIIHSATSNVIALVFFLVCPFLFLLTFFPLMYMDYSGAFYCLSVIFHVVALIAIIAFEVFKYATNNKTAEIIALSILGAALLGLAIMMAIDNIIKEVYKPKNKRK